MAGWLDAVDAETRRHVTVESRWGGGWRWQVLTTAVAVTSAAWRARGAGGLPLLAVAVATWCVMTPGARLPEPPGTIMMSSGGASAKECAGSISSP